VELPKEGSETAQIPGIPQMTRKNYSEGRAINQGQIMVENLLSLGQLLFCFQESAEAEESLF